MAHQEILRQQEQRLREQLAAEKAAAFEQIEEERMANEKRYSEKMATLEMEKFRYKCSKEILDTEKKAMLDAEIKTEPLPEYRPYQSNLLDEIRRIMQHPSEDCLHQTQLKVNFSFIFRLKEPSNGQISSKIVIFLVYLCFSNIFSPSSTIFPLLYSSLIFPFPSPIRIAYHNQPLLLSHHPLTPP